jgi:hypothetical protein
MTLAAMSEPMSSAASSEAAASATAPAASASPATSATTPDVPAFGWSAYAERVNGRFAMVGFVAVLLVEAVSGESFLRWAGLMP